MNYNGNLAYDFDFEAQRTKREQKVNEEKRSRQAKLRTETARLHRAIIISVAIFALCAGFMITRNVAAYESKQNVERLQKELNELKEYSSQKAFEMDKSIDLEVVEETATTKLNMIRPEKYQMVYVNVKQDDVTEITANQAEGIKRILNIFAGNK